MKHLIIFLALLLSTSCTAQIFKPRPDNIPKEFFKELPRDVRKDVRKDYAQERKENTSDDNAYQIPPEESIAIPITPDVERVLNTEGSWGRTFLNIPENEADFVARIKGSKGVVLYIFDTGEADHEAIRPYIIPNSSKSYTNEPVLDGHNHSTHIAGSILGFTAQRKYGILAEAAKAGKVKLIFRKICTNTGSCPNSYTAQAISDAAEEAQSWIKQGYAVGANLSIGGSADSEIIKQALVKAVGAGMVLFAANGNSGGSPAAYPGRDENTIGVAAIDKQGKRANFSQYGNTTVFSAPGVLIPSFCKGSTECLMSGTSMATPHALAVWAAVKLLYPNVSNDDILNFMAKYATDIAEPGFDKFTGYGAPKLKPYLDNQPSEDDDPGDGPGDGPIEREEREMHILLKGPYKMRYALRGTADLNNNEAIASSKIQAFTSKGNASILLNSQQELNTVEITDILLSVKSKYNQKETFERYEAALSEFTARYTLGLLAGSDKYDAAYWTAYFFDLIADKNFGLQLSVKSVTSENQAVLSGTSLREWESRTSEVSKDVQLWRCDVLFGFPKKISNAGLPEYLFIDNSFVKTIQIWSATQPVVEDFKYKGRYTGAVPVAVLTAKRISK